MRADSIEEHLAAMGHAPYQHPTPDGSPRRGEAWLGTMLARFRFALALADGGLDDTEVDLDCLVARLGDPREPAGARLLAHLVGRSPTPNERSSLASYSSHSTRPTRARGLALALSSPAASTC